MNNLLEEKREEFFKAVSEGDDLEAIQARGAANIARDEANFEMAQKHTVKIERVELKSG